MSLLALRFSLWYIAVYLVQPQHRFHFLIPWHLGDITFLTALVCFLIAVASEDQPPIVWGPATKFCVTLLVMAFISNTLGAFQISAGWNPALDVIVKNCAVIIMMEAIIGTNPNRLAAVLLSVCAATLWWFKAGLRGVQAGGGFVGARIMGPNVGLVQGPNEFGIFASVMIPILLGISMFCTGHKWIRRGTALLSGLAFMVVLQTGSRSGLLCLIAMGPFMIPFLGGKKAFFPLLIMVGFAVFAFMHIDEANMERFRTIPQAFSDTISGKPKKDYADMNIDEKSAEDRRRKNVDTWKLIKDYPILGAGINPNRADYPDKYAYARGTVHNELLMAGQQMGFLGMALLLSIWGYIGFTGFRVFVSAKKTWPALAILGWSLSVSGIALAVGGFFNTFVWNIIALLVLLTASRASDILKEFQANGTI